LLTHLALNASVYDPFALAKVFLFGGSRSVVEVPPRMRQAKYTPESTSFGQLLTLLLQFLVVDLVLSFPVGQGAGRSKIIQHD
jgi:hypothetical protein